MAAIEGAIKPAVAALWRRYYPDYDPNAFAALVAAHASPQSDVLEIGAGSGVGHQRRFHLKGRVKRTSGSTSMSVS